MGHASAMSLAGRSLNEERSHYILAMDLTRCNDIFTQFYLSENKLLYDWVVRLLAQLYVIDWVFSTPPYTDVDR